MTFINPSPEISSGEGYAVIGHSFPRKDVLLKAVGEAEYCADIRLDGMLYMAARHAPAPSGRIRNIDISRARRLPGVHKVLLAKDLPHARLFGLIVPDTPVICGDIFRHVGDVLALVAAESQEVADEAVALIEVDYEEIPGVFSVEEALLPGARPVHEEHPRAFDSRRNILSHFKIRKGDAEGALRVSPVIVEHTYRTQMVDPAYIETDMGLAIPHRDGSLTLTGPMQAPFLLRRVVDRMLGLPHSKIRVVSTMTGGGFGTKEESSTEILGRAGLMARLTGRPIMYAMSREVSFIAKGRRIAATMKSRLGAERDGSLKALHLTVYLDKGPYASIGGFQPPPAAGIAKKVIVHATGPYEIPHVHIDVYNVFTNNPTSSALRGLGVPQVHFAAESQMDELAHALGIEPLELRLKNCLSVGSLTATGQRLEESVGLEECLKKVAEASGYRNYRPHRHGKKQRGLGLACFFYSTGTATPTDTAAGNVYIADDGSVLVGVGIIEYGQGSHSALAQIVAEELGVPYESVSLMPVDTASVPEAGFTAGSRCTAVPGMALIKAARQAKEEVLKTAGELLEVSQEDLATRDGIIFVKGHPGRRLSFAEAARTAALRGRRLCGQGYHETRALSFDPETGRGDSFPVYTFGAQMAEVDVDVETGEVKVLRVWAAADVGKAIHPLNVEGQIEGGVIMGMGQALMEGVELKEGVILNASLEGNPIPTSNDTPGVFPFIIEHPYSDGPFGAKGVGESATCPALALFANAVRVATGLRVFDLPLTAEKIVAAGKKMAS